MRQRLPRNLLPRTGQTAVVLAGDDGTFQAGWPGATRFVDLGNGTVRDRACGLTWVKQPELIIPGAVGVHATNQVQRVGPNYGGGVGVWVTASAYLAADLVTTGGLFYVCAAAHTSGVFATDLAAGKWRQTVWTASAANLTTPATMNWTNAINNSLALEYAGFDDWRLPNFIELCALLDVATYPGGVAFTLYGCFPNTKAAAYWSATSCAYSVGSSLAANFNSMGYVYNVAITTALYVRPVRGGRVNG